MKRNKIKLIVVRALMLSLLAMPLISVCAKPALAEPIKIGALMPFTGPFADYGEPMKDGLKMRLEEAKYEVAGRPIELIMEDSASDTSVSLEKAKKLVTVDGVKIIIGTLHSGVVMGLAPWLSKNKITTLGLMTKPLETGKFGHFVAPYGTLYSDGMVMGWYAYDQLGYRTITTLGGDFIAGKRFVNGGANMFKERGGTVVQQQWSPIGTADFGPYLTAMKDADAVMIWLGTAEIMRFLKQYKQFGLKMPVLLVSADQLMSKAMRGLGDLVVGLVGSASYTSRIDNSDNRKYVKAFKARFGKERNPERHEHCAYTPMSMVIDGLKATGGDDSFDKLRPAILALKPKDYPQGPLYFKPSGHAITARYIVKATLIDGEYLWDVIHTYAEVLDPRL